MPDGGEVSGTIIGGHESVVCAVCFFARVEDGFHTLLEEGGYLVHHCWLGICAFDDWGEKGHRVG